MQNYKIRSTKTHNDVPGGHVVHPLHVLSGEVSLPLLPSLGQCHVQRLAAQHLAVHGGHRLGGLVGRAEAHESESLRLLTVVHDLREKFEVSGEIYVFFLCVLHFKVKKML